jgi:hypothetical protein
MNAVGIASYEKTTPSLVARKAAEQTDDPSAAYFVQVREATKEYTKRNTDAQTFSQGKRSMDSYLTVLRGLDPPPHYASAHGELVDALTKARARSSELRSAVAADDRKALRRLAPVLEREARAISDALASINRIRAAE